MELENVCTISYEKLMSFIRNYYYEKYHICMSNERLVYKENMFSKDVMENNDIYFLFEYETFNGRAMYTYGKLLSSDEIIGIINYHLQSTGLEISQSSFYVNEESSLDRIECNLEKAKQKQKVKE